jgi:heptosyltransferase-2
MKDLPSITRRYCEILKPLGVNTTGELPEFFPDEPSKQNVNNLFKELNLPNDKKIICIIPSSKHFTKTYPAEYYSALINKFDSAKYSFVLIGKGIDKSNIDKIKSKTGSNVYDLCDKLNVLEAAELMKRCWLIISCDTGPMHIAEAVNAPLIILAGSSVREFGFYPQNKNSIVLENNNLKCRPCSHIGRSSCPKGHFKCMRDIKPEQIFERVE